MRERPRQSDSDSGKQRESPSSPAYPDQVQATETTEHVLSADDPACEEIIELLSDEYTNRLLDVLSVEQRPARELLDTCNMSRATVYRRLNRLADHGLVTTDTQLHPDGHHRKVFSTMLEGISVEFIDDEITVCLEVRDGSDAEDHSLTAVSAD